jgi:hypothetical protein
MGGCCCREVTEWGSGSISSMFGGIRAIMVTIGRWGGVAMVVAMDDVSFECGRGLLTEVRRNLVIRVYVGLSTFNKWIFRVHLRKGTCTCTRHGDTATTEGLLGLVGSGVRQGSSGDIDGVVVVAVHQRRLGETDRRANMGWRVGGTGECGHGVGGCR